MLKTASKAMPLCNPIETRHAIWVIHGLGTNHLSSLQVHSLVRHTSLIFNEHSKYCFKTGYSLLFTDRFA